MIFDLTILSVLIDDDMAKQALGKGLGALIKKPTAKKNAPAGKKKQAGGLEASFSNE